MEGVGKQDGDVAFAGVPPASIDRVKLRGFFTTDKPESVDQGKCRLKVRRLTKQYKDFICLRRTLNANNVEIAV